MIRILLDSSADFTAEEVKSRNMELVPINITLNGKNYLDGIDITKDEFYEMLIASESFPMTAQPSPQDFLDIFEDAKEKGDELIYLSLSSALSGTFQSATLAKNMAEYEGIYLVDTLSATRAIRLMAEYACKLRDEGKEVATIVDALEEFKSRVVVLAVVDSLEYLQKGGRLSKAAATVGELANLKPIITVTTEGEVGVLGKALGRNKALSTLVKMITEKEIDTSFPIYSIFVVGEENTEKLEQKLGKEGVRVTKRLQLGPTIGAHIGPGGYGVVFVTK
ncbi:MAG: DegV family protein [Agathobacter sp.]|nr:DegV family protein [Lachnospiraceae bacterium]MBR3812116.1 DegV family protein [Agathobacter sp.]